MITAPADQQDWGWGDAPASAGGGPKPATLSRWQLDLFVKCPRCFWLLKRHGIKQPAGFPMTLHSAIDVLLKAEFDACRAKGELHPVLMRHGIQARLFGDTELLRAWRNNFQGLRWRDPSTGCTLYGAVDDILEFPDGTLAVVDYKSSGAKAATIYPSYQLQMDVYTFLLQRLGYRTAPRAFFAFFMAVKDAGFDGRLPFRGQVLDVETRPERVPALFQQAVAVGVSEASPPSGAQCDVCRWFAKASPNIAAVGAPRLDLDTEEPS